MAPITVAMTYTNYAIVAVMGSLLAARGLTDMGSLASYLVFVRQAAMPFNQVTQLGNFLLSALAGAERLFSIMDVAPEADEGTVALECLGAEADGPARVAAGASGWAWRRSDGTAVPLAGDVRFHDVTFGYEPGQTVLENLSLFAKPGQKIAFVGSTGAGKTTITNLINRFYDVRAGQITYDGIDVRDIDKASLRASLGIVLQDTHLFRGTVADNIRFGKLDATDEEVRAAAVTANADGFIRRLPKGYDTPVTADGANLSAGQRQLLAIARSRRGQPARAHPRRGHELGGHAHRGAHRAWHGRAHGRSHRVRHRPQALDREKRQRHHGARARQNHRARHARGASRTARGVLAAVPWHERAELRSQRDQRGRVHLVPARQAGRTKRTRPLWSAR